MAKFTVEFEGPSIGETHYAADGGLERIVECRVVGYEAKVEAGDFSGEGYRHTPLVIVRVYVPKFNAYRFTVPGGLFPTAEACAKFYASDPVVTLPARRPADTLGAA